MKADSPPLPVSSRPAGRNARPSAVGWLAVVAIAGSVLLMFAVSAAGRSAVVPGLPRTWPAPPWWLPVYPSALVAGAMTVAAVILGAAGVGCGLVAVRRGARPATGPLLAAGLAATAVFTVLPAAGSTDPLSYAAYGRIAATGHNPYLMTPAQLRASGDPIGRQTTQKWQNAPSLYGPLATAAQWGAAKLGGASIGRIIFWLKLTFALAFGAVAVALERLLRADPAARARAHLLWTVNPLMLWAVLAGAHIDGLAAGLGFLGLILVAGPERMLSPSRALGSGLLIGAATAVKSPYLLFGAGLCWAARRSPLALAAGTAGAALVLLPSYLIAGPAALSDLGRASGQVDLDSLWRVFYGFGGPPGWLTPVAVLACAAMAALLAARLPPGPRDRPAIRPALVVTLAWLLTWPLQRAWYDAIGFCLLAVFPASRLDWLLLARSVPATIDMVAGAAVHGPARHRPGAVVRPAGGPHPGSSPAWQQLAGDVARLLVPGARLAAAVAVVVLCVTGAWGLRPRRAADLLDGGIAG